MSRYLPQGARSLPTVLTLGERWSSVETTASVGNCKSSMECGGFVPLKTFPSSKHSENAIFAEVVSGNQGSAPLDSGFRITCRLARDKERRVVATLDVCETRLGFQCHPHLERLQSFLFISANPHLAVAPLHADLLKNNLLPLRSHRSR